MSAARSQRPVVILVAACALLIACLAVEFPRLWAERWVQDDAYVSFRYARNLVRGDGLTYNPGERVEGYSNFLWTVLAAAPLAAGADDPLPFMHAVSAILWWATYGLLFAICVALWRDGAWAAPLGLLPLALHWSFNMWFFSGMETPVVTLLTIGAVGAVAVDPRRQAWAPLAMGVCGVGLLLTRPDTAVVLAALVLTIAVLDGAWIVAERRWRRCLAAPALPLLLVWMPYQVWRIWYYGSFFPNTYYAKVAYLTFYERGWRYLTEYASLYGLWPFAFLLLMGAVLSRPGMQRRYLWATLSGCTATAIYVVRLGGDFMEWRFVTPVSGLFYPAVVVAAGAIGERLAAARGTTAASQRLAGGLTGAVAAGALAAVTLLAAPSVQTISIPDQETIASLRRYTDPGRFDWRAAGQLCATVLPPHARIATTSAGIIPYLCDRPCLDLHGLTDPAIAHTPIDPQQRGRMGHEHWLQDYGQIGARGVDVVVEWANPNVYPRAAVTPPEDGHELLSARLPDGRFIDFTVLNPAVLPAMRSDPRIVAYDPSTIADRTDLQALRHRFADAAVVDRLDWGNLPSEIAHRFEDHQPPGSPYVHSWHTKLLRYRPPLGVRLEDDGRRVYGWAQWQVFNVSSASDLILVGRHDHTGAASFTVEVNGRPAPDPLVTPERPDEWWGESWVRIPKALLVDGANTIRITRRPESVRDAEWYYMWFLQERATFQAGLGVNLVK
jgi:arabinofuranosyltransferase